MRKLLLLVLAGVVPVASLIAALLLNNNVSRGGPSHAELISELDHSIDTATQWMTQHPEIMGTPPLMFMVSDMAKMSGDPRLRQMVSTYLHSKYVRQPGQPITWYYARLVDPHLPVPVLTVSDLTSVTWQNRWDAFGEAPSRVELPDEERADMFSATKYHWGTRQHQLVALDIFLYFNKPSAEQDRAINAVTEGVARDQIFDFRVNDNYPQRLWLILAAGRPDLVRKRWVEQLLDYQRSDGSWKSTWHGWGRGVFEFTFRDLYSGHTTPQAAYTLYLIKYRYPQWIEQHYK